MNYENLESEFLQYASIVELTEGQEMSIAGVKSTIDIVKTFLDAKDAKSMRAITALDIELSNIETELASKNRELLAKDEEISQLKEQIKKLTENPQTLTRTGKFYYKKDDERPFCPVCYDSTEQKVSLLVEELSGWASPYKCMACNATYLP